MNEKALAISQGESSLRIEELSSLMHKYTSQAEEIATNLQTIIGGLERPRRCLVLYTLKG